MRGISYAIGQGFRNLFRNKWYTFASIMTITACLFLFSTFFAIVMNFRAMLQSAEEGVTVTCFFQPGVTEDEILNLKVGIEERDEVSSVTYVSADEAWAEFSADMLQEYADIYTENPLADSANLEIYLRDVARQEDLVFYLQSLDMVREVRYSQIAADTLSGVNSVIGYVSIGLFAILFANSIFLISNTVIAGITVRKNEINIMKYIGATDSFVRGPFIVEGLIIGLIGSILPLIIIYYFYNAVVDFVNGRFAILTNLFTFMPIEELFHYLIPISIVLGVGIGFIGSALTTRRHIHV